MYYVAHILVSGRPEMDFPLYMILLSLTGNLFIGGLEEAGWSYILQPGIDRKCGYALSSAVVGIIWLLWHVPLFFIPGTAHYEGLIDFWMFAVQIIEFRFFYGAICRIAGKSSVFMCVLFHSMFNAASSVVGILPMTWRGTIVANTAVSFIAISAVIVHSEMNRRTV